MKFGALSAWKTPCAILLCFLFLCAGADAFQSIRYTVKKGDTLWRIAHRYNVSIRKIERINKVTATRLLAGSRIVIPLKRGTQERRDGTPGKTAGNTSSHDTYRNGKLKSVKQIAYGLHYKGAGSHRNLHRQERQ